MESSTYHEDLKLGVIHPISSFLIGREFALESSPTESPILHAARVDGGGVLLYCCRCKLLQITLSKGPNRIENEVLQHQYF